MKFFKIIPIFLILFKIFLSCEKKYEKRWLEKISLEEKVLVSDISAVYFDTKIPLEDFKNQYPWFQGSFSDEDFNQMRTDSTEVKIYQESLKKIDKIQLQEDLNKLFSRVKHYFPQFKIPHIYLYSSGLQSIIDPILFNIEKNMLFVDISAFLGKNNQYYKGLEQYFQITMNPQNMIPKIAETIAQTFITTRDSQNKFIDQIVNHGKVMILQDVFIPSSPHHLRIGYTPEQLEWAIYNEENIWNYFVENDLVFSDDTRLADRFIAPGPFSKFYTEIDQNSPPKLGIFIGWQICKSFYNEKNNISLKEFLDTSSEEIFSQSSYNPNN